MNSAAPRCVPRGGSRLCAARASRAGPRATSGSRSDLSDWARNGGGGTAPAMPEESSGRIPHRGYLPPPTAPPPGGGGGRGVQHLPPGRRAARLHAQRARRLEEAAGHAGHRQRRRRRAAGQQRQAMEAAASAPPANPGGPGTLAGKRGQPEDGGAGLLQLTRGRLQASGGAAAAAAAFGMHLWQGSCLTASPSSCRPWCMSAAPVWSLLH